jgi:AcrR family transcriptional regulator
MDFRYHMAMKSPVPPSHELSLRERKKLTGKRRIQDAAIELVESRGFQDATVEEIASEAQVSPSTVYRYFGTKQGIFMWEEYDESFMQALSGEVTSAPPVEAMRHVVQAMASRFSEEEERMLRHMRVISSEPELQQAMRTYIDTMREQLAGLLAAGSGRAVSDLRVQVVSSALMGALVAVLEHWSAAEGRVDVGVVLSDALDILEDGLTL